MQILGMPLDAWLLLLASVGLGLGLELAFVRAQKRHSAAIVDVAGSAQDEAGPVT